MWSWSASCFWIDHLKHVNFSWFIVSIINNIWPLKILLRIQTNICHSIIVIQFIHFDLLCLFLTVTNELPTLWYWINVQHVYWLWDFFLLTCSYWVPTLYIVIDGTPISTFFFKVDLSENQLSYINKWYLIF